MELKKLLKSFKINEIYTDVNWTYERNIHDEIHITNSFEN